jgi:ribosomal-protein-serine acetyltransferase
MPAMLDRDLPLDTGLPEPVMLRRLTVADADAFAAHVAADQERLSEHLAWPAVTDTAEGAAAWLGRYDRGEDGRVLLGGAWRGDDLLGGALLMHHDPDYGNVEVGCWLVAAGEGHGVAAAACRAVIAIGRRELGVERVEWRAAPENVRSRRLAERLGFVHEGTLRANYLVDGRRLDTDVLSLVGDEIDRAIADTAT